MIEFENRYEPKTKTYLDQSYQQSFDAKTILYVSSIEASTTNVTFLIRIFMQVIRPADTEKNGFQHWIKLILKAPQLFFGLSGVWC